jgi:CrcB protein
VTAVVVLGIGVLGGFGAVGRFVLDGAVATRLGRSLPYGTFAVNVAGAFVLGVLSGAELSGDAARLAGTGFLGAFTTFSTWMLESHRLAEDGERASSALNLAVSLAVGIGSAALGRLVGGRL